MLTLMRQLLRSKIFGTIVFGFVIIGMAVWGIDDIFSGGLGNNIVKAGPRGISQVQLDQSFERALSNIRRQSQQPLTRQDALEQGLLDQFIASEGIRLVNLGFARSLRADASDAALTAFVEKEIDGFKDPTTGKFSLNAYYNALSNARWNQKDFEQQVRDDLTLEYVRDGLAAAINPPNALARLQAAFDNEVRRVSWFTLKREALPELGEPTPEEVAAFYDARKDAFTEPERRRVGVVAVTPQDFIDRVELTEDDILQAYEAAKERLYSEPEERRILEAYFETEDAAKAAFGRLAGGASLDALPGLTRQDERTLQRDGIEDPAIASAVFSGRALTSAIFGPYSVNNTWQLIRLEEIIPGAPLPLDDTIRAEIQNDLALREATFLFNSAVDQIDDLIIEGLGPDEMAARLGVTVKRFGPVAQSGQDENGTIPDGITTYQTGIQQAFTELFEGETGDRVDERDLTYLVTLEEVVAAYVPDFEEVDERVITALNIERAREAFAAAGEAIKARLLGGESTFESEAERFGAEIMQPPNGVRRGNLDVGLPRRALVSVFGGQEGEVIVAEGARPSESNIILLESVSLPEPEELDALAPLANSRVSSQLTNDIAFAMDREIRNAIVVEQDARAIARYKSTIENNGQ